MSWVLILWCVGIITWIIAGSVSGSNDAKKECAHKAYLSAKDCVEASNVGTGIGAVIILGIGFFGFVFLSLIWFMTKPKTRLCQGCGSRVKKGVTTCPTCNYDFLAVK